MYHRCVDQVESLVVQQQQYEPFTVEVDVQIYCAVQSEVVDIMYYERCNTYTRCESAQWLLMISAKKK